VFRARTANVQQANARVERVDSPSGSVGFVKATFGPVIGIYANHGPPEGPAELHYEYLLVVAHKPGASQR
jgi:hypothetical protein